MGTVFDPTIYDYSFVVTLAANLAMNKIIVQSVTSILALGWLSGVLGFVRYYGKPRVR